MINYNLMTFSLVVLNEFPTPTFKIYKPELSIEVLILNSFLPTFIDFDSVKRTLPLKSETVQVTFALVVKLKATLVWF